MKEITRADVDELIQENEIGLLPTQQRLSLPIIKRIFKKMFLGLSFRPMLVCDNRICDGHHRYLASLLCGRPIATAPSTLTSASLDLQWHQVYFDESDWDTAYKIELLNRQDAEYNNLTFDELVYLLK